MVGGVNLADSKIGGTVPSKHCDIRQEVTEFGVCFAGFWSYFGLLFPHYDYFFLLE